MENALYTNRTNVFARRPKLIPVLLSLLSGGESAGDERSGASIHVSHSSLFPFNYRSVDVKTRHVPPTQSVNRRV